MQKGSIARKTDRGYGFINAEGQDKDLFFHAKDLTEGLSFDDLKEGDEVTFEQSEGPKGPQATNISRA